MPTAQARCGGVKPGSIGEFNRKWHPPKPTRRVRPFDEVNSPYRGAMAQGWRAYHRGAPRPARPTTEKWGKGYAYYKGWMKAMLAEQQGKRAL